MPVFKGASRVIHNSSLLMKQKLWFIITLKHLSTIILMHPERKQNDFAFSKEIS